MISNTLPIQIIEFVHPGVEYKPNKRKQDDGIRWCGDQKTKGIRLWNMNRSGKHKRKFMKLQGQYIDKKYFADGRDEPSRGLVTFWGEWEAQSKFHLTGRDNPYCIHEPFLDLNSVAGVDGHNTDPYVFGNYFWYTNCGQHRKSMRQLAEGSLILFGTQRKKGFLLDTVFVVGQRFVAQSEAFFSKASSQISETNFKRVRKELQQNKVVFYQGLMNKESPDFFSFVPGKRCTEGLCALHERPILPHQEFDLRPPGPKQGIKMLFRNHQKEGSHTREFAQCQWRRVADYCLGKGCTLITQIDEPRIWRTGGW